MRTPWRWLRGQDPSRKAHIIDATKWFAYVLCGNSRFGRLKPAKKTPRCKRCIAIAKRLKLKVRTT